MIKDIGTEGLALTDAEVLQVKKDRMMADAIAEDAKYPSKYFPLSSFWATVECLMLDRCPPPAVPRHIGNQGTM